jgi:hypothetical protein
MATTVENHVEIGEKCKSKTNTKKKKKKKNEVAGRVVEFGMRRHSGNDADVGNEHFSPRRIHLWNNVGKQNSPFYRG